MVNRLRKDNDPSRITTIKVKIKTVDMLRKFEFSQNETNEEIIRRLGRFAWENGYRSHIQKVKLEEK